MKTVLCYGDSNTYGWNPMSGKRYDYNVRWTGKLQQKLGKEFHVIEEGLNGRTTVIDELGYIYRNGFKNLETILYSHIPIDELIIMLGTNDTKILFNRTPQQIAIGLGTIIQKASEILNRENDYYCRILVVAPPWINKHVIDGPLGEEFDENSAKKSSKLALLYEKQADRLGVEFIDLQKVVKTSNIDGVHLTLDAHEKIAEVMSAWVKGAVNINE